VTASVSDPRASPSIFSILAALLFSCVVVIPFLPSLQSNNPAYVFEVEMTSDAPGEAQLFFEIGRGISEADSVRARVAAGEKFQTLRFELGTGDYRQLRFDPIDRPAHLQLRNARIRSYASKFVHRFSPAEFTPLNDIASLEVHGDTVAVATASSGADPNLRLNLAQPLELRDERSVVTDVAKRAAPIFAALLVLLFAGRFFPVELRRGCSDQLRRALTVSTANPQRTVMLVAGLAVVTSTYPVIFLGKSFVSPNFSDGTVLLYDQFPTLPGYQDASVQNGRGADVGAIFWQQVPYSFVQNRALVRDGELPLWNRFNSCGTVLLGQGQSMFGDPFHFPVILANGAAWAWDLKYLFARWLLCTGVGLIVWRCSRHLLAAAITAFSAAFVGFFIYRLNHPAYFSFCYAPWILYAWLVIVDAPTWRRLAAGCALLTLASICELNSGTVKEAYMQLLGQHLLGLVVLVLAHRSWKQRFVLLGAATWAGTIFVLLTAPTWLTLFDSLKQAYTAYNVPTAFQIHPSLALGFFDELFYRPLITDERVFNPSVNFVVLAGVLYFIASFRHASTTPHARAITWGSLVPVALVFGLIPPQWIARVPFVGNVFHIDNSFSCVLIVAALVLAGFGWASALTRLGTSEGRVELGRAGALYALLVFPWIALTHTVHRPTFGESSTFTFLRQGQKLPVSDFIWGDLWALTLALVVLAYTLRRVLVRRSGDASAVLLLALTALTFLWRHGQQTHEVGPTRYVFAPGPRVDFHARSPAVDALKADQHGPERVVGLNGNLFPGWTETYDLEGISGPDALINPYYREITGELGFERIWDWRLYVSSRSVGAVKPALDFLNVRHYADLRSDQGLLGRSLTPVKMGDLDIYRSETTWPRAFFSSKVELYDTPKQLAERVRSVNGHPFAAMQRTDFAQAKALSTLITDADAPAAVSSAQNYHLSVNKTKFTVNASGPGVAVLHEPWLDRSFRATLDGKAVPYWRINHAFKAVYVPLAGPHTIEFAYWPRRMTLALALSGIGLALALFSWIAVRWVRLSAVFPVLG
jgi:hypothetical protein